MSKFKSFPDIAVLVSRLVIGAAYLEMVYQVIKTISAGGVTIGAIEIIALALFSIGSILIMLGLFTRWTILVFIVYFLIAALFSGNFLLGLLQKLIDISIFASVWLIDSGKYSLDYKFFRSKKTAATE